MATILLANWVDFLMHNAPDWTLSSICFWCVYFVGKMLYCAVYKPATGVQTKWRQTEEEPPSDFNVPSTDDLIAQTMQEQQQGDIIQQAYIRAEHHDTIRRRYVL